MPIREKSTSDAINLHVLEGLLIPGRGFAVLLAIDVVVGGYDLFSPSIDLHKELVDCRDVDLHEVSVEVED